MMAIGGETETKMGSWSGRATAIGGRIRIEGVNGGMEAMTRINGEKKTQASEGTEAGMVTATVAIQINEIAH